MWLPMMLIMGMMRVSLVPMGSGGGAPGVGGWVVLVLVDLGYVSLDVQYVDGTKIESASNRYTFVWRKSVERYKERLENKINGILKQIEEGICEDNQAIDNNAKPIDSKELKQKIKELNNKNKSEDKQNSKLIILINLKSNIKNNLKKL